jgi:hypothetical protein
MFTFCQECMQVMLQVFILSEGIYQRGRQYINNRINDAICPTAHTMQKTKFGLIMTNTTPGHHIWYSNHTFGWMSEKLWFISWQGPKIFSFLTFQKFKPAPESTQHIIQWVHSLGVKWLGSDDEHSIPLVAKLKISAAIPACHHMLSRYTQWQHNPLPWWWHVSNHTASEHAIEYECQALPCEATEKTGQTSGKNRVWSFSLWRDLQYSNISVQWMPVQQN